MNEKRNGVSPTRVFYPMSDGGGAFRVSYVSFDPRGSSDDREREKRREGRVGGNEKEGRRKEKEGEEGRKSEEVKGGMKRKVYRVKSRRDGRIRGR